MYRKMDRELFDEFVYELVSNINAWSYEIYDDEELPMEECDIRSMTYYEVRNYIEDCAKCYGYRG